MALRVARWLLFATLLVPLVVFPGFFFPFVTTRAVYFRVLVELAVALLLYVALRYELKVSFRRDFIFWTLLGWLVANTIAAVFGVAFIRSLFGDHERMGGVWFWVHLVAYYVALRVALRKDDWPRFFRVALGVAAAIATYGLIQYWFRPFNFGVGGVNAGSTIGNPGLLAIYLLANVAFCALLAVRARAGMRWVYMAIALLLIVAMVFSGNRSSTLALFVGSGTAILCYTALSGSLRTRGALIGGFIFASAFALPFAARIPSLRSVTSNIPALSRLSSGVDSSRVIQWRAAVDGIRARPLFGVGPENYQIIWSSYHHPEMHRFVSDSRWDRAHNAYLDAFATAGIFGFLSLLAVWIALGFAAIQAARRAAPATADSQAHDRISGAIVFGFFVAYAVYVFFWFFDLNSTMLWIALAAFVASRATMQPLVEVGARRARRWQTTMVLGLGAVGLASVLYVHGFETLRMAHTLVYAGNPNRPMEESLADFESVFASPAPVTQHAFLMYAGRLRDLYPRFRDIRNDPEQAAVFDRAFVLAVREFERQAVQDPQNEKILVQYARVLILGAYYYGNQRLYETALAKLHHAVALAPRRVNTHLVLGVAYLNAQRPDQALQTFLQAHAVYPPLGQTHLYVAEAYSALGKHDLAGVWLRSSMVHGQIPSPDFVRQVAQDIAAAGNPRAAATLTWEYLLAQAGTPFIWSTGAARSDVSNADMAALTRDLLRAAGDTAKANRITAAAPVLCSRPIPLLSLAGRALRRNSFEGAPDCRELWRRSSVF